MEKELAKIGYNKKWIDFGFLSVEDLKCQIETLKESADKNTEHYRYGSFIIWLASKDSLTESEITNYLILAKSDEDEAMGASAAIVLLKSKKLTDDQFGIVSNRVSEFGDWTQKQIIREKLKRKINSEGVTNDLLLESLNFRQKYNDNSLIEVVIRTSHKIEYLTEIKKSGVSKRMNNLISKRIMELNGR